MTCTIRPTMPTPFATRRVPPFSAARLATARWAAIVALTALALLAPSAARAAIFTVTNVNDSGAGSLRKAIQDANATPQADEIRFNLGASKTITLASALPGITTPIDINGTSQPGWTGTPLIEINGQNVAGSGFVVYSTGSKIRGLVINRFGGDGIVLNGGDINTIQGNWIGLNAAGTAAAPNGGDGIALQDTSGLNTIGGTTAAQRNVISGNLYSGISISSGSYNNITGNYIGTNAAGTAAVPNQSYGVRVLADGNFIGGTASGAGNLISGNERGVSLEGSGNVVLGNVIGLNASETAALPNNGGISVYANANQIGSNDPAGANVISGNDYDGVYIDAGVSGVTVAGNRIGTNRAGTVAFGNALNGVRIDGDDNTIGGPTAAHGNLISGNGYSGIAIDGAGNEVLSNVVGLNAAGTQLLGNGTGVSVYGPENVIGAAGQGNTLSGNDYHGLVIYDGDARGTVVQGNKIGTRPDGVTPAGNLYYGVQIHNAFDTLIGGDAAADGNVIAHNGFYGVFVDSGDGNAFMANSIYGNGFWGIDLAPYGVSKNDPADADLGPNRTQNYPVLTSVVANGGSAQVSGVLSSTPNSAFSIELFSSPACDPSGFGEGKTFLGRFAVQTDAAGFASFDQVLPVSISDPYVTATATSVAKMDTSEFSPCATTTGAAAGVIQFSQEQYVGYEVEPTGKVQITVTRALGAAGTVTVNYATSSAQATSGVDYESVSGTLTFGPGEVVKTFDVPVYADQAVESQENIQLVLSAPGGGAVLGAQATSVLALIDCSPDLPTAYVSDASVAEGPQGTQRMMQFTITLSEHSAPVTVSYGTVDGSATAGVDYLPVEDQVTFAVGELTKTIEVPVLGDGVVEGNETFFLVIYGVYDGTLTDGVGEATIYDADAAGAPTVCTGGGIITKPKIVVNYIGDAAGNEVVKVRGKLKFPGGQPAGYAPLDAIGRGAQILVEDLGADGAPLFEVSHRTEPVPPGPLDDVCSAGELDGWTVNALNRKYIYTNTSGAFPGTCSAGSARGLKYFRWLDRRHTFTQAIEFFGRTRPTTIAEPVGPLRLTVVLGADQQVGDSGACASFTFDASDCKRKPAGNKLVCR